MSRLTLPLTSPMLAKICFALSILACYHANATTLLTPTGTRILATYIGCFGAWHEQYTKLQLGGFIPSNTFISCAEKCLEKYPQTKFVFLRGVECQCAQGDTWVKAEKLDDKTYCNSKCPVDEKLEYNCGGNRAYSVFCLSTSTSNNDDCGFAPPRISLTNVEPTTESTYVRYPSPVRDEIQCGKCSVEPGNQFCTPANLSPIFDYFPENSAQDCVDFCNEEIHYVQWDQNGEALPLIRRAYPFTVLMYWNSPDGATEMPICRCGDEEIKENFDIILGQCGSCPGDRNDICGGMKDGVIFGSVYCIDVEDRRCPGGRTSATTTTTPSQSSPTVTNEPSTTDTSPTESDLETTSTTIVTSEGTTTPTTTTTSSGVVISSAATLSPPACRQCSGKDRHGHKWKACVNETATRSCSKMIPNSVGTAYWECTAKRKFKTWQPVVSQCTSEWVQEMNRKLGQVDNMDKAFDLTANLSTGCNNSHKGQSQYFGHEIANLASAMNTTICKVWDFERPPNQTEFETLVNAAIDLNACLINSSGPWEDLSLLNKSLLSNHLVESTEDVLFHLTQIVNPNNKQTNYYSKTFNPMSQFTAVAEAFDKERNETYEFPQNCDPERGTCVKLPEKWTDLLPQRKVEVAVITIEPESVAKVMSENGIYEVNGQQNKIFNGRMISFSVTSSSQTLSFQSEFYGTRSKSLKFKGKGMEISYRHIVDAYGDKAYDIRRKLHEGEKARAVLGSVECVYKDTKKHNWSQKGCHVVRSSRTETICECSHLSTFALLMDVHRYIGKQHGLEILTLVLCPLSELGLILTIIILSIAKNSPYKTRSTICKHLSFCLFLGNGMILIVLDQNFFLWNDEFCMGAAMAAHYVFLCAFMWMLLEGVQLYRMVIHVFDSGKSYMRQYGVIAYGSPVIIIAITAGVGHMKGDKPYGGDAYCWLVGDYIWAFMVPVAVVITINLTILFIALKTAYQLEQQTQREKKLSPAVILEKIRSYRVYFRGCFSLTVILGLTWVVGFFTLMEGDSKITAAYLFTILNASQGFFIFLFTFRTYIGKVRLFTRRKLSSYFPSFLLSSSANQSPIVIRKPFVAKGKLVVSASESKF